MLLTQSTNAQVSFGNWQRLAYMCICMYVRHTLNLAHECMNVGQYVHLYHSPCTLEYTCTQFILKRLRWRMKHERMGGGSLSSNIYLVLYSLSFSYWDLLMNTRLRSLTCYPWPYQSLVTSLIISIGNMKLSLGTSRKPQSQWAQHVYIWSTCWNMKISNWSRNWYIKDIMHLQTHGGCSQPFKNNYLDNMNQ